jgi:hypothetical protein
MNPPASANSSQTLSLDFPDLAERHFPPGEREAPAISFLSLVLLLVLGIGSLYAILWYRTRRG